MYKNITNEFSFILKLAKYGVGVFSTHNIAKGTLLRVFGSDGKQGDCIRKKSDVPKFFQEYCIDRGDKLICPKDFGSMSVGWYINHSKNNFNAIHKNLNWHASRDIKEGEEILVDYNTLGESEDAKDDYYKND